MLTVKRRAKVEKLMTDIRGRHPYGACWVCGTRGGIKTSRSSYGLRCRKCFEDGKTLPDIVFFEQCSAENRAGAQAAWRADHGAD